jgi:hypothetical protein
MAPVRTATVDCIREVLRSEVRQFLMTIRAA